MNKIKRIIPWITAGLILITAISLIVSCISIYRSGSRPFNRQIIMQYAERICPVFVACVISVICGCLTRENSEKTKAIRDQKDLLKRYPSDHPQTSKERAYRKKLQFGAALGLVCLGIYPVIYLTDAKHFSVTDVNGDILQAALVTFLPTAAAMVLVLFVRQLQNASISREIEICRSLSIPKIEPEVKKTSAKSRLLIRGVLLLCGVALVCVGAINGGAADVLGKAIRICTECIGLG